MVRRPVARVGRAVVGTAVVAGTAGAVHHHQNKKYAQQDAAAQQQYEQVYQQGVADAQAQQEAYAPPAPDAPAPDLTAQLQQLAQLHDSGRTERRRVCGSQTKAAGRLKENDNESNSNPMSLPVPAFLGGTKAITMTPVVGTPRREYAEMYIPGEEALEDGELRVTVLGSGNPWNTRAQASASITGRGRQPRARHPAFRYRERLHGELRQSETADQ